MDGPDYAERGRVVAEDFLEHYGVKGMRWGVRRSREKLSAARASRKKKIENTNNPLRKGARKYATSRTNQMIRTHKNARDGKRFIGLVAKADKYTWGRNGKFEKYHNSRISELERSNELISKGKKTTRTILWGPQYSREGTRDGKRPSRG